MKMQIPFLKPPLAPAQIIGAHAVMETERLTAGEKTELFEEDFSDYIGTQYAIAVNSGTSALDLIFKCLLRTGRLQPGAKVALPSFTFVACANVLVNNGLEPYFMDIKTDTLNLDEGKVMYGTPHDLAAVLCVHTFGRPMDMDVIQQAAREKDLIIVEDCAEACGAVHSRQHVGSIGHAGAFSFIATKNMTTGEGGMVTTDLWEMGLTAREIRAHGVMNRRKISGTTVSYRDVVHPGVNYRMTEFQASLGIDQLAMLDRNNAYRRVAAEKLTAILKECDAGLTLFPASHDRDTFVNSIFTFLIPQRFPQSSRDEIIRRLYTKGIEAKIYFDTPIHKFTYYRKKNPTLSLQVTEDVCARAISLPMYPSLTAEEVDYMGEAVNDIFRRACGG